MYQTVVEGMAELLVSTGKVTRSMPVFYNPVMRLNRDVAILFLNSIKERQLKIADLLAGTGVRCIRYALELSPDKVASLDMNDHNQIAYSLMQKNVELNKLTTISVHNKDADQFLIESRGFDYIEIDPFGTPNPFLDQAVKHLSRRGILGITATDTAPLAGTYPDACLRKYWALPKRDYLMHETGLRILIRKIQLIGAQYERALIPVYSFSKEHYFRVFMQSKKGKKDVDKVITQHGMFNGCGPMWLGPLWDRELAMRMVNKNTIPEHHKMLSVIADEAQVPAVGFYDVHSLIKTHKIGQLPKKLELIAELQRRGHLASETHFLGTGIRTNCPLPEFIQLLKG